MHDFIEHYGKVIIVLVAVLFIIAVVAFVNAKTAITVKDISYEQLIKDAWLII